MMLDQDAYGHKKERGFTLLEVLMTMALTSILISISVLAFRNLSNLQHVWDVKRQFVEDLSALQGHLHYAQNDALFMTQMSENRYALYRVSAPVFLEFNAGSIILTDKLTVDTFQLTTTDIEIVPDDVSSLLSGKQIINRLAFKVGIQQQIFRVEISVKCSAKAVLELVRNDIP